MVLFCVLWAPCCYLFWLQIRPKNLASGWPWALLCGSLAGLFRFFMPTLIDPDGFGISRWLSAAFDYIALPVLVPFACFFVLKKIRGAKQTSFMAAITDICGFMLVALIPISLVRSIAWSAQRDPIRLVLSPLLWTAIVIGLYPLLHIPLKNEPVKKIIATLSIAALLAISISSWWQFFCQNLLFGYAFLFPPLVLMLVTLIRLTKSKEA
jgi:membrane-associated HD superfamily phosphohydrolase